MREKETMKDMRGNMYGQEGKQDMEGLQVEGKQYTKGELQKGVKTKGKDMTVEIHDEEE